MTDKLDDIRDALLALTEPELVELKRRLGRGGPGWLLGGVPTRPQPPRLPDADAVDRSIRGRTIP
jgi:hypothetical protein